MPDICEAEEKANELGRPRPEVELYDPWQRQFTSRNKQNEFLKAIEPSGTTGS